MFEITYDVVVFITGLTAVLAALGVILCSSPIYCALYLIGHMICLALLFLLYHAEFVAAVQIIVYAGAVMILFLFIIALLGGRRDQRVQGRLLTAGPHLCDHLVHPRFARS